MKVTYLLCVSPGAGSWGGGAASGQPGRLKAGEESTSLCLFLTDTVFWEVPLG